MKKIQFILFALCAALVFTSCDKNDTPNNEQEEGLKLSNTKWQLKEINFTSGVKPWEKTIKSPNELFGWAPFMFSGFAGIEFTDKEYTDDSTKKSGKVLNYVTVSESEYKPSSKVFWVWNFQDNGSTFDISQLNKSMPPYDFSLTKATDLKLEKANGKRVLTFTTTLTSTDQDKLTDNTPIMAAPKLQATAIITIEEVNEINNKVAPKLKLNGAPLGFPSMPTKGVSIFDANAMWNI